MSDWTLADYSRTRYDGLLGLVHQLLSEAPCACGATIVLRPGDIIFHRVRAHVLSEPHASWSRATFPERYEVRLE